MDRQPYRDAAPVADARAGPRPRILLVDDDPMVTRALRRELRDEPWDVECADSGQQAWTMFQEHEFDVVVSDECMPGLSGAELLARVRDRAPSVVRILLSGQATLDAALRAINLADVYRFLLKPCPCADVAATIRSALGARAERKHYAVWQEQHGSQACEQREALFEAALEQLFLVFQPLVLARGRATFAYEALVRSRHSECPSAELILASAHNAGGHARLTRRIFELAAGALERLPDPMVLFVNVEAAQILEGEIGRAGCPLDAHAPRVVIEVTERERIHGEERLLQRIAGLRSLGYRIAIDDLGAGYAGLTSVTALSPDLVKVDMDLVRGIHHSPTRQRLVAAITSACRDLGIQIVAEGIECEEEAATVVDLGCELLQGYHLGRPAELAEWLEGRSAA